jgi:hypothetical protein
MQARLTLLMHKNGGAAEQQNKNGMERATNSIAFVSR